MASATPTRPLLSPFSIMANPTVLRLVPGRRQYLGSEPGPKQQAKNNFGFFIYRWRWELGRPLAEIRARCINVFQKLRHPESMTYLRSLSRLTPGPRRPIRLIVASGFQQKRSEMTISEKDVPLCRFVARSSVGEVSEEAGGRVAAPALPDEPSLFMVRLRRAAEWTRPFRFGKMVASCHRNGISGGSRGGERK